MDTVNSKVVIALNGKEINYNIDLGYAAITRIWKPGDSMNVYLPMSIRRIVADKKVKDDENLTALEYGPIVYCVEGIDNNNQVDNLTLPDAAVLKTHKRNDLLGGVNVISEDVPTRDGQAVTEIYCYSLLCMGESWCRDNESMAAEKIK